MHDEETGNVHNRTRVWSPSMQRFLQRDPLGYPDGLNAYAGYHVLHGHMDPAGLQSTVDIFAAATTELRATGLMAQVGGMWNAMMAANDTDVGANSDNPNGWLYYDRGGVVLTDNTIYVPTNHYNKNGTLKWPLASGSNVSYISMGLLLHEMWHGFYDQIIECECEKVLVYLKKQSASYGNGVVFPNKNRKITADERA